MPSTLILQPVDCLPPIQPDPRTVAGYVDRRTDKPTMAKDPPKSKPGVIEGRASYKGSPRRKMTSDRGDDGDDEDDDRREKIPWDGANSGAASKSKLKKSDAFDSFHVSHRYEDKQMQLNMARTWASIHARREPCRARRARREAALIKIAPEEHARSRNIAQFRLEQECLRTSLDHIALAWLRQSIEKSLLTMIERTVVEHLKTSDFLLHHIKQKEQAMFDQDFEPRILLQYIVDEVLQLSDGWWYVASEEILRVVTKLDADLLLAKEYLMKMRQAAIWKSSWSSLQFSSFKELQLAVDGRLEQERQLVLDALDYEFFSLGNDLMVWILHQGRPITPQLAIISHELSQHGWHQSYGSTSTAHEKKFWRYRVGTINGDESYVFKVQLNEEVIGIWTAMGDIDWDERRDAVEQGLVTETLGNEVGKAENESGDSKIGSKRSGIRQLRVIGRLFSKIMSRK
ncbi:hypothetical protein BDZ45DRAFT_786816 [Acephala macrosclerotiorum]|nr:hypothetical protein BDZ45DRAFT_786816 [Acephala macrosclerotiorum]